VPLPPAKINACINLFPKDKDKTKKNIVKNQRDDKCGTDAEGFDILVNLKTGLPVASEKHSGKIYPSYSLKNYF